MKGKGVMAAGEGSLQRQLLFSSSHPPQAAAGLKGQTQAVCDCHPIPNSRALTRGREALERPELVS